MGSAVLYTFDVTDGYLTLNVQGVGSTTAALGGTFSMTIYQSDGHIGVSDSVLLQGSNLRNTGGVELSILSLVTANVGPESARILDFLPVGPAHIGPGGVTAIETDAYLEATISITGVISTLFATATTAGDTLPFDMIISTSVTQSDTATATIDILFPYEIGISDISQTLTLDLVVHLEGTTHVVPDPALGGLTALGLGGAGAWLRRRRS
jgi:hypothetical protein